MIPNEVTTTGLEVTTLSELTCDNRNANKGTERGTRVLEDSLREHGAGRSILIDRNGRVIAGNKTLEGAASIGLEDVIVVKTDGKRLVAVQRTDVDLDSPEGRRLAIADNRAGELNLEWDASALEGLLADGVDLDGLFSEGEAAILLAAQPTDDEWGAALSVPDGDKPEFQNITFTLHDTQAEEVKRALDIAKGAGPFVDSANENSNGNALARICEEYVTRNGTG